MICKFVYSSKKQNDKFIRKILIAPEYLAKFVENLEIYHFLVKKSKENNSYRAKSRRLQRLQHDGCGEPRTKSSK